MMGWWWLMIVVDCCTLHPQLRSNTTWLDGSPSTPEALNSYFALPSSHHPKLTIDKNTWVFEGISTCVCVLGCSYIQPIIMKPYETIFKQMIGNVLTNHFFHWESNTWNPVTVVTSPGAWERLGHGLPRHRHRNGAAVSALQTAVALKTSHVRFSSS